MSVVAGSQTWCFTVPSCQTEGKALKKILVFKLVMCTSSKLISSKLLINWVSAYFWNILTNVINKSLRCWAVENVGLYFCPYFSWVIQGFGGECISSYWSKILPGKQSESYLHISNKWKLKNSLLIHFSIYCPITNVFLHCWNFW